MTPVTLEIPRDLQKRLWSHLLNSRRGTEEAAFLFVRPSQSREASFVVVDWFSIPEEGFAFVSAYHFELEEETWASVIKRAHDLEASIVEVHSHLGDLPPSFSASDLFGFREVVPHVWWRLRGRPYFALVVSNGGFDGLAWVTGPETPERIAALDVDGDTRRPSGLSRLRWTPSMYRSLS